ncbi:MAG TPA: Fe-S cluster assembly protein SufD [Luteimonas sp.]|jgi:Fe-S cluster assembly protein SufD|nr:Fe-S cluster assembly protein SufD [Luteimonas sp.]
MSALLDSLAAGFSGDAARRAALDEALRDGLPPPRTEAWKYTPLRALERRSFAPAAGQAPAALDAASDAALAAIPAPRMVFVNGRFDAARSDLAALPATLSLRTLPDALSDPDPRAANFMQRRYARADEVFARLNAALAGDGFVLRLAENARLAAPLHVVFAGAPADADQAWHLRHFIELRRGAEAAIVEHHLGVGDHAHLGNALLHVHLAAGATLQHVRLQAESARATLVARTDAVLARGARYERLDLELGAALGRHELNVRLEGEGAMLLANGVQLADGRRHVDTRLGIEHIARDTACDLSWRGIAAGRARAVFHGGITIRAGADGTDASLSNKNLLLSDQAEVDSQPVLEIHADEVKAAHGATVGQLDPTAMFYLRSRGLPEAQARSLLTAAFCHEALVAFDPALREPAAAMLDRALAALESGA